MEGVESLLDTLFDEENFEDAQDVEMLDVEEGELIEQISKTEVLESSDVGGNGGSNQGNLESNRPNSRHRKKKKKNKRKKGSNICPNVTDINRFVLDACKILREKKSYLMYSAVGCLGVSALSDLIKEACGGQKTADGRRYRNGGGILWNIIKEQNPNAYKEIMTKGREFEKQFKLQTQSKQEPKKPTEASINGISVDGNQFKENTPDGLELMPNDQSQHNPLTTGEKRVSVHDRIRVPVQYDDLLEDPNDDSTRVK